MSNPIWTCDSCDTTYTDNFQCTRNKRRCMNCCTCAAGLTRPDTENKTCVPVKIEVIKTDPNNTIDDDLPF